MSIEVLNKYLPEDIIRNVFIQYTLEYPDDTYFAMRKTFIRENYMVIWELMREIKLNDYIRRKLNNGSIDDMVEWLLRDY